MLNATNRQWSSNEKRRIFENFRRENNCSKASHSATGAERKTSLHFIHSAPVTRDELPVLPFSSSLCLHRFMNHSENKHQTDPGDLLISRAMFFLRLTPSEMTIKRSREATIEILWHRSQLISFAVLFSQVFAEEPSRCHWLVYDIFLPLTSRAETRTTRKIAQRLIRIDYALCLVI